jgi:hypothetical protein
LRQDKYQYKCWVASLLAEVFPEFNEYWEGHEEENIQFSNLLEQLWESYKYD